MTKTILILGMALFTSRCPGQQVTIDSLLKVLKNHNKEDTVKLNLLNDIVYAYSTVSPAKGLVLADQAIGLAKITGDKMKLAASFSNKAANYRALGEDSLALIMYTNALKMHEQMHNMIGVAKVMHNIGIIHSQNGNYYKALDYHNKSLSVFELLNEKQRMASSFNSIGVNYMYLTDYSKSLEYFLKALKIYDQLGDGNSPARANTLTNIGIIYKDLSKFPLAIEYHEKALKIYEATGDQQGIANVLGNIGTAYDNMNQSTKALAYYERALAINTTIGNEARIASDLTNMAIIYNQLADYPKALTNLQQALKMYKEAGDKNSMAIALNEVGSLYAKAPISFLKQHSIAPSQRLNTALNYHKQALQLSQEAEALDRQRESWEYLSTTYEAQKEYPNALHAYKQLSAVKDSILNDEKKQEITKMQMQFDFEKQQAALKAAHDKKQAIADATINEERIVRNALMGGSAVLIIGAFTSFIYYKRRRDSEDQKNEALFNAEVAETEMKALRSQMNPHFIFNSLNSISDYISKNNLVAADNYLTRFAKVMRMILENSEQKQISLADDLKGLELYMQLEALRLNNKFTYEINVDPTIDQENTLVPPLILQPFVENSIWHGMAKKDGEGKIIINIEKENQMLNCIVEDNGMGRKQSTGSTPINALNRSLGMKITKARIDILNKIKNSKAAIELSDLTEGMRVVVRLPFEASF
jgi:tetratricopeptide (TPR) repeat protein